MELENYKNYITNFLVLAKKQDCIFLKQLCTLIKKYLEVRGRH